MSDSTTSLPRKRLRTWVVLAAMVVGLLLTSVLSVWAWLRSEGDLRAVAAEMSAAGFAVQPQPPTVTDPLRVTQARRVHAAVQAIPIEWPGRIHALQNRSASAEFRAYHQTISSQAVCDAARDVIALGDAPLRVALGERLGISLHTWKKLFGSRLVVAEGEEFALCLAAMRVLVELSWDDGSYAWGWYEFIEFCRLIPHRLADRREQMRPLADWLDSTARRHLDGRPQLALHILRRDLVLFRHGEQALRERGSMLPEWLRNGLAMEIAMRAERASLLRAQLGWLEFLMAHPAQPRLWLDEAERRSAALAHGGSWLGAALHQELLFVQHPFGIRHLVYGTLYARLLAAELRGSPWPADLCDRAGGGLRRWEEAGRLIGAYSVGPDGRDDGADSRRDIPLRLYLDPPDPSPAP